MNQAGKWLIVVGLAVVGVGLLFVVGERLGLGRLPGDFVWRGKRWTVSVPLATSLLVSVALTLLLNLWLRRK